MRARPNTGWIWPDRNILSIRETARLCRIAVNSLEILLSNYTIFLPVCWVEQNSNLHTTTWWAFSWLRWLQTAFKEILHFQLQHIKQVLQTCSFCYYYKEPGYRRKLVANTSALGPCIPSAWCSNILLFPRDRALRNYRGSSQSSLLISLWHHLHIGNESPSLLTELHSWWPTPWWEAAPAYEDQNSSNSGGLLKVSTGSCLSAYSLCLGPWRDTFSLVTSLLFMCAPDIS